MGELSKKYWKDIEDRLTNHPNYNVKLVTETGQISHYHRWNDFPIEDKFYRLYWYEYSLFLPYHLIVKV